MATRTGPPEDGVADPPEDGGTGAPEGGLAMNATTMVATPATSAASSTCHRSSRRFRPVFDRAPMNYILTSLCAPGLAIVPRDAATAAKLDPMPGQLQLSPDRRPTKTQIRYTQWLTMCRRWVMRHQTRISRALASLCQGG